ncbi:outer membrane protein assembly factor BamA [Wenyingzhuangia fucanilytica]|uniref:Outer membrane protein assembly factor BamA n=1 Tax=Wenyingzhuangia fucanilytica TaxID=1790137 RepID=A0A1B1Y8P3_9FLAO|nr:outer membrane protein assembly factor BamA [Wenyingzhuangia fucanilytica]ANW97143.1 outer membrane protein assembly factor BamA [Wenyingzhuangia fucanilytica]
MNKLFKNYFFTFIIFITNLVCAQEESKKDLSAKENTSTTELNVKSNNTFSDSNQPDFSTTKNYLLGGITVTGTNAFSEASVISYSGLKTGQEIKIPGDKLTSAIKKLHNSDRFSDVEVYVTKMEGNTIYLEIAIKELPQLNEIKFIGVSKSKEKTFKKDTGFTTGKMLTENLITSTENYIKQFYIDKGYLKTKVNISTTENPTNANQKNATVFIDKGKLVKIKDIDITGNEQLDDKSVRKALKDTKRKFWGRFWKRSKYVEENYNEDKKKLIEKYRRKGFRDARIVSDSITWNEGKKTIDLHLNIEEGNKYFYKEIKFLGNKSYKSEDLQRILRIEKGDVYDSKTLEERVNGDGTPDSDDISTLYQNNGYLFSQINLVETKVENDSITVEVRIHEDDPATISHVSVIGNDKTNDHVIYRELRTRPGDLYSKDNIIRSIRELGQMGFFDAENITPDLQPNYADKTVGIEYSLTEKGSSQIELQGGYGSGSFIGTLGLSFNNFSLRNIFKKDEYKPLPLGDGQQLSLRLQASRFSTTNSLSFTEPWLGGKKPRSFSFSIYNTKQYGYGSSYYDVDKSQKLNIFGASIGIGERLKWPDDYFSISNTISYRRYTVNQFNFGSALDFDNGTGVSNNLSYNVTLQRNSAGPSLIFPTYGSTFSVEGKFTPPFSLFSKKEYNTNNERFKWLEYYKINLKAKWYTALVDKFVLMTNVQFGYLGNYNDKLGEIPFERYFVGGDGMNTNSFDGREVIGLRGYPNSSLSNFGGNTTSSSQFVGATVYDKFSMEVRYPITLNPSASIYALGFVEAGNAYINFSDFNPFDVKKSAGLGIRIFMPAFGLLGIDFGHGFDNVPGENEKSGWQTHFIIGQQF